MGLSNTSPVQGNRNILTIVGGQFAKRCEATVEGAVARKLTKGKNEGKEVYELRYSNLSGYIQSGVIRETTYGLSIDVVISDEDDTFYVEFSSDSSHFKALASRLPNIDRMEPVALSLVPHKTKTTSTGNPVISMYVSQNGNLVDDYYVSWTKDEATGKFTAEHLNGLPDVKKTRKGYDFTDQDEFLLTAFETYFKTNTDQPPQPSNKPSNKPTQSTAHSDDLKAIRSALKASPEIGKALTMMDGEDGEAQAFALNHWDEAKGDHDAFILAMKVGLKLVKPPAADKIVEPDGSTNAPDDEEPPIGEAPDDVDLGDDEDTGGLPF